MRAGVIACASLASAGCGRIAFDPLADARPADAPTSLLPLCFTDDFNDGDVSDWQQLGGEWGLDATGPDGSIALRNDAQDPFGAVHPDLRTVTAADITVDVRIDSPSAGDFFIHVLAPGWTIPSDHSKFRLAVYPVGSDNSLDNLRRVNAPVNTNVATAPTRMLANAWHRVDLAFAADHAMTVHIDGALHLTSGPDPLLSGPFDLVFDFFSEGAIDNVRVHCER